MEQIKDRTCKAKACGTALPEDAHRRTKYCSRRCTNREAQRRRRLRRTAEGKSQVDILERAETELEELRIHNQKLTQRLAVRDRNLRRLEHALKRAEHQVEVAANEQAQWTRAVRDELAVANNEVDNLRRNWSSRTAVATATQEMTELRERLAVVTERYDSLVAMYRELSEAAQYAATERKHLQGIVRQWDGMCVRLYKATGGRPKKAADKKVLATWSQFRKLVRK